MYGEELPHEVILSIQRILELEPMEEIDSLDALTSTFSPVDLLNNYFPDEASLAHIGEVNAKLNDTQLALQQEIDTLQTELKLSQDPDRMTHIQEMISDLLGQMSRIREKATESEAVVRNITKDIQVLDLAKKNLILSMTVMKRLQMLVNALTQLEDLIKEKKYSEVAQTLAAVKQISASFKAYTAVPHISRILKRIQEVQGELRTQLDVDFDSFYLQDPSKPIKPALIAEACLVADVLGPDVHTQIVDRFVALELKEYRRIFRTSDEAGQLDNISRRFAWFKRLLNSHELEQGRVFPSEWRVGWHLLAKFSEITRDDLSTLLVKARSSLTVKSLLDNLQLTTEFETSMARKWATPFHDILKATSSPQNQPPQTISSAFEPHMGIFVDAQDKALADMLAPHRKLRTTRPQPRASLEDPSASSSNTEEEQESPVLPSSTELFYFYGQSLEQCAKLSTGKALFDLAAMQRKWLRIYAEEVLTAQLKRPQQQLPIPRRSMETRVDIDGLNQACLLINTADYCQTTALELEEKIRSKINEEYKEKITFQVERDLFISAISTSITSMLREVETASDPFFNTMARTSWNTVNQVSGPSAYSEELVKAIEQVVDVVRGRVEQKKYLRNFMDKACSLILVKFTNALVRSRPLKEIGAEQLLIDLQTIKAYLAKMPGEALQTTTYAKGLAKTTTRLEALLKVIVTPVDPAEGFILNYTLLIGDASFSNFQKILDLKGTPKSAQNTLLDSFLTITSTKTDLESTSFLSSLDMDPPTTAHLGGSLISPGASRVSLPLVGNSSGEGIFASMVAPPMSGPPTGSSIGDNSGSRAGEKREVFSDFRRFVSFGLRKDSMAPP
ncbi:Vps53-like protein [Crucibulum laeve]|uniref:Vps53-like protein n=1 Tax=Crucibulum laeve TaxID=68775 RepID=A0A5C3MFM4_9AGAR|nr:Vps53-like protein [Crucibulum laeve]